MRIKLFKIDAFTTQLFGGNPAAVCPLNEWLEEELLQKIALENNLAETAFFAQIEEQRFHLKWFTPEIEMDLCGHATLAAAYVLFEELDYSYESIYFETQSGTLLVKKIGNYFEMNFPVRPPVKASLPEIIRQSLNIQPLEVWKARDYLLVYDNEETIKNLIANKAIMNQINIDPGGVIVTAKGNNVDFVSRLFTPQASVFEDPVTGSAHCTLVPFWADRLHKTDFHALQISKRGGELFCRLENNRVYIKGKATKYLEGTIMVQ